MAKPLGLMWRRVWLLAPLLWWWASVASGGTFEDQIKASQIQSQAASA